MTINQSIRSYTLLYSQLIVISDEDPNFDSVEAIDKWRKNVNNGYNVIAYEDPADFFNAF